MKSDRLGVARSGDLESSRLEDWMTGWAGFEPDELVDNADYIREVRFGGDPRSDEEIKEAAMQEIMEEDGPPYDDDEDPEDVEGDPQGWTLMDYPYREGDLF